jgi:sugar/nucleoside kinase (ribokinase family)
MGDPSVSSVDPSVSSGDLSVDFSGGSPVVVVGDIMTDVVAQVGDPLALGSDTAAHVVTRQGGAGANVAAWLAERRVPVVLVGRVGDDPFGREAVAALAAAGVRPAVAVDPVRATGTCVVLVGGDGERTMLPDAGSNSGLTAGDLPSGLLAGARHLHLSGYTLLNPGSREAGLAAVAAARAAGGPVSRDAASAAPLEAVGGKEFLRLTEDVGLAFCTLEEAEVLVGTRDPDVAAARLTATYEQVVLKLGAAGARWSAADDPAGHRVPQCPCPDGVVDSTGAGDAFAAGYLAATFGGAGVPEALAAGCALAARVVSRVGARP